MYKKAIASGVLALALISCGGGVSQANAKTQATAFANAALKGDYGKAYDLIDPAKKSGTSRVDYAACMTGRANTIPKDTHVEYVTSDTSGTNTVITLRVVAGKDTATLQIVVGANGVIDVLPHSTDPACVKAA